MALKRRIKKLTQSMVSRVTGQHTLLCKECNVMEKVVSLDVSAFTCWKCVMKMVAPPDNYYPKEKSDKPRGWQLKKFFEHNGEVYSKGKLITDAGEIEALRNPIKVEKKAKVKKSKSIKKVSTGRPRGRPKKIKD